MALLEGTVVVVVFVDIVFVVVVVDVVVALLVVTDHINLRLLKTTVEFLWRGGGLGGMHSHFHVQPNYSVEAVLCCLGVVTISKYLPSQYKE